MSSAPMSGRRVVVTGGSSGIGLSTARDLARLGATVTILGRDEERCEMAVRTIRDAAPTAKVDRVVCDFARLSRVPGAAREVLARDGRVDVLVANAGLMSQERVITEDGNELTFQVDHLAHFRLQRDLDAALRASAPSRVVVVSSGAHRAAPLGLDFDDLTREARYAPFPVYAEAKLANVMFTYALARRFEGSGVTANAVHPGGANTRFTQGWSTLYSKVWAALGPLHASADEAAETQVWAASEPSLESVSGAYFHKKRPKRSSLSSYDVEAQERLWSLSERLTGDL